METIPSVTFFPKNAENEIHFKDWECCICTGKNGEDQGGTVAQKIGEIYHIYHYNCLEQNSAYSSLSPLTKELWDLTPILDPTKRRIYYLKQLSLKLKSLAGRISQSPTLQTALGVLSVINGMSFDFHPLIGFGLILVCNGLKPIDEFLVKKTKEYWENAKETNQWIQLNEEMGASKRLLNLAKQTAAPDNRAAETTEIISNLFSCARWIAFNFGVQIPVVWLARKIAST